MKASLYMYSKPKYNANMVNNNTNDALNNAKLSIQNIKCESIKSRQRNHFPKSIK